MALLTTFSSTHKKCFICGKSNKKLYQIKHQSIKIAFVKFQVIIKPGLRHCGYHLNDIGVLKDEIFEKLPLKKIEDTSNFNGKAIKILLSLSSVIIRESGIFDKFKNLANVDNDFCYKITQWSKNRLIKFSKYITSINDTDGRTKEQMIAIYRYWLRRGLDQCSLAMFKNTTSQQQISHYLKQIRLAIHKDFVPFFLGARSRNREYYLQCNNITTNLLFDLKKNDLAIFADATYTRLEKSANNEFQYRCWSQQKLDLLVKPFLICCADGYIIDCYGPFQANLNDAKIFEYILKTDIDLLQLLLPNQTYTFLDRGKQHNLNFV